MAGRHTVSGIFAKLEMMVLGVQEVRAAGFRELAVHAPVGLHEIETVLAGRASPVRFYTLVGGVAGCIGGIALTVGTTLAWPLVTGGKPIVSIPPFLIIAFELTILLAALGTVLGFLVAARLPRLSIKPTYDSRFMVDHYAIVVACGSEEVPRVREVLRAAGAEEVHLHDA